VSALVFEFMKAFLSLSIWFNLVLLVALMLAKRNHSIAEPAVQRENAVGVQLDGAAQFRWSQLESTNDYRAYIANLRAAGCPETTLRAIVMAETAAAFSLKRQQLDSAGKTAGGFSPERAKQIAVSLLNEQTGERAPSSEPAAEPATQISHAQPSATMTRGPAQTAAAIATYPMIFQSSVLNDATLNNSQKSAVQQIQQQFVNAIGGPNQDPQDPGYSARWQTAQSEADDALRAALGNQAYQGYQLQHYYTNFQQVMLNAGNAPVIINPSALAQ
jgi:hypothetical protein